MKSQLTQKILLSSALRAIVSFFLQFGHIAPATNLLKSFISKELNFMKHIHNIRLIIEPKFE